MNYDLENMKELVGILMTLDENVLIPDVYIEMDSSTIMTPCTPNI